jgi:hypothetical protein
MNYLFRYLSTMKPAERERLAGLDLSRRERDLLEHLLAVVASSKATKADAAAALGMSGAMFDKTSSIVLRTILADRVPGAGIPLLEHLAERAIMDLLLHEMRRQQKSIDPDDPGAILAFLREAFRVLHMRFSSEYPADLVRQMAHRIRRLDRSRDTEVWLEACMIGMAVWTEASRRQGEEEERRLVERLRRNDARIDATVGAVARFRQLKAWTIYYGQLRRNPTERFRCLEESVALCEAHPAELPIEEKVLTLCQIAEDRFFYNTDLDTPRRMYRELFARYPDVLAEDTYHSSKYVQLCLSTGEYEEAERVLIERFGEQANLEVHGGGRSKTVALLWTKLLLLTDRLDEARRHLDDALLLNQKMFYLQFEVECRMLHTALCYLQGDLDDRRLQAHIRFLRSKGMTTTTTRFYPWYFKLVGAFIDERATGKPIGPKLEAKLDEFMEGAAAQYGVLLRKLRSSRSTIRRPSGAVVAG